MVANRPLVLQSMIPALVHKALQLCNSTKCRGHNIRGLVLGFRYKHYKWEWWYMPLTCRLRALHLELLCDYGMQRSRAWCGTPPILGVVNMVGTRNFTCYMGAL